MHLATNLKILKLFKYCKLFKFLKGQSLLQRNMYSKEFRSLILKRNANL